MATNGLVALAGQTYRAQQLAGDALPGLAWVAVGRGNWADRLNPPLESASSTGLVAEIARRVVSKVAYLVQDDASPPPLVFKGKKYREILTPGPIVAFFATFPEGELTGESIVEEGLFGGTVVTSATPLAFPGEVSNPGILYWINHRPLYVKGPDDSYEVVCLFEQK